MGWAGFCGSPVVCNVPNLFSGSGTHAAWWYTCLVVYIFWYTCLVVYIFWYTCFVVYTFWYTCLVLFFLDLLHSFTCLVLFFAAPVVDVGGWP